MRRILTLLLLAATPVMSAQRRRAVVPPAFPPCVTVEGTPAVTFTRDQGRTLAPVAQRLEGIGYTYGLAALDVPQTLLSWHRDTLSISTDAGCHWRALGDYSSDFPPSITAAEGGRAYIWSDRRLFLMRYDADGVVTLKAPGPIIGLAAAANDGRHVRAGDGDGAVWDSTDAGATWTRIGELRSEPGLFYRFAFDPNDLDHVVAGTAVTGAYVSRDAGKSWTTAVGFMSQSVNAFNFAIFPVDGNVVWAMALDMGEGAKHIYRSTDGGLTYTAVVDAGPEVTIVNQPVMVAHPANRDVMYFVFGTYFQGYGTDLFRYDASARELTKTHNDYNDINAIAFAPGRPDVMYLGLEVEGSR